MERFLLVDFSCKKQKNHLVSAALEDHRTHSKNLQIFPEQLNATGVADGSVGIQHTREKKRDQHSKSRGSDCSW